MRCLPKKLTTDGMQRIQNRYFVPLVLETIKKKNMKKSLEEDDNVT